MLTRNRKKALENKENDGIIIEENTLASIINSKNSNILINQPNSKKRTNESVSILYEEPSPKKFKKDSSYSSLNLKKQEIKNESRSNAFGSSFDQKKKSPKKKPNGNKSIEAFFFPSSKKKLQTSSMQVEEINESDDEEVAETISSGEEVPIETESAPSTPKKSLILYFEKKKKSNLYFFFFKNSC